MRCIANLLLALALALVLVATPAPLFAQSWPQRAVRVIVPLGAGSATDIAGRLYADRLSKRWGQPVIIENRPGGDMMTAAGVFAAAHNDHTLLLSPATPITVNPLTHEKLPYDPADLIPISVATEVYVGIAMPASLKANSLGEFVALARSQPGKLNWAATPGSTYLTFAAFQKSANLPIANVPYRDIVQAQNDLAEERIHLMMCAIAIVQPQIIAGKLKLLAVANAERAAMAADIPTVREAGYPDLQLQSAVGFFGSPAMSRELRERISADIRAVAVDSEIARRLLATGQVLRTSTPDEFAALIEDQRAHFAEQARTIGLSPGN
jgi:tripartite-type tricarboxylate transporter receptor subunit TctC